MLLELISTQTQAPQTKPKLSKLKPPDAMLYTTLQMEEAGNGFNEDACKPK